MSEVQGARAGIYCRISLAGFGDTTKTDDQARICRELAERLGWTVAKVYTDHSQSAWKKDRKREQWDQMLRDIYAGEISAVIVYHGDRLIRQPFDLEQLLGLAESKGIRLASPTGIRNLDVADDRFILRIEAAQACRASDDTSRRKKAQYERMRREGLTRPGGGGGRCFGFESDGFTHRQSEADIIRDASAAVIHGESLGSVVRTLNISGVTTTAGNAIRQGSFRRTLLSPRMAGLMPDGASKAAWRPILPRGEWETLRAILDANYKPPAGHGAQYLLSGIALCGRCSRHLYSAHGATAYKCATCAGIRRNRLLLDAYVAARVVRRLNHPDNPEGRVPELPGLGAEFRALTEARAEVESFADDPSYSHRLPLLLRRLDAIDARLAQLREMTGESARSRLLSGHAGITRDEFLALPLSVQRALIAACFEVTVMPASKRGPGFRTEDVRLTPR